MGTSVILGSVTYTVPAIGETYGDSFTTYLIKIAEDCITVDGGSRTLLADVDFGANYGLKSAYYKSRGTVSTTGILRIANAESVGWRNAANGADLLLTVDAYDTLNFDGNPITSLALGTGHYVVTMNAGGTASEYALIDNDNIDAAAAIVYSKLSLGDSILNADINSAAGIDASKLADGSVSNAELQYIGGVTSDVQTQLDAKLDDVGTANDNEIPRFNSNGQALQNSGITIDDSDNILGVNDIVSDGYLQIDDALSVAEISTPSTPSSGYKKIYPKSDGKMYTLDDAGNELEIGSGAGAGELNYITNPSGATDVSDWTESTDGQVDISRTDTASELPRENLTGTGLKIVGTGSTGTDEYVEIPFTLDDTDVNKKLKIKFALKPLASYVAGELEVSIYDVTNVADITVPDSDIPNTTGEYLTSFDTTDSLSYKLRIRKPLAATTTGVVISDIIVGPGSIVTGAIVTEWESWTPSTAGFGSTTDYNLEWRRVGSSMEMRGDFKTGSPSGSITAELGLPNSLTIGGPTSEVQFVGSYNRDSAATGLTNYTLIATLGDTFLNFSRASDSTTKNPVDADVGSGLYGSAEVVYITAWQIPIAEWAGGGTVNLGANDVEYYSYYDVSATTVGNYTDQSKVSRSPEGSQFSPTETGAAGTTAFYIDIPNLQETDVWEFQLKQSSGSWSTFAGSDNFSPLIAQSNKSFGMGAEAIDADTIKVIFGGYGRVSNSATYANAGASWSGIASNDTYRWRVVKHKAGIATSFGLATSERSGLVKAEKQYVGGTDFTITADAPATVSFIRSVIIPYQTYDGAWRAKFNIALTHGGDNAFDVTITGIKFKDVAGYYQSVTTMSSDGRAFIDPGTESISVRYTSNEASTRLSGDVELDEKPDWAD